MANGRRKRLEREIDRDARVTTSGYVHEVMAATLGQLQRVGLATRCPDPVALFDEVEDITRKFRSLHRRLNDARINRRGVVEVVRASGCLITRPLALAGDVLRFGADRWYLRRGACERDRVAGLAAQPDPDCAQN